jgi:hypothetical protein
METQRQWSDKEIARTTPCLLGFYSIVTLLAEPLFATGQLLVQEWSSIDYVNRVCVL